MVITGSVKKDYYVDDDETLLGTTKIEGQITKVDDFIFMREFMRELSTGMKWTKPERKIVFILLSAVGYSNRDIGKIFDISEFIVCRVLIDARKSANKIRQKHSTIN